MWSKIAPQIIPVIVSVVLAVAANYALVREGMVSWCQQNICNEQVK